MSRTGVLLLCWPTIIGNIVSLLNVPTVIHSGLSGYPFFSILGIYMGVTNGTHT